ncbi:hypothetical protein [Rhizobium sp. TRM95796]|uniref:hypothetical protein n=1 Tax=Rhizobium sp. TRM95796 TaxID=2979862 RepID=UPI0021E7AB79|nr:hypothetical protein [Rhizobium sp. TRM95796]MCV3768732.1 hypothetical protein [Rhizobium sp. TRM95796]
MKPKPHPSASSLSTQMPAQHHSLSASPGSAGSAAGHPDTSSDHGESTLGQTLDQLVRDEIARSLSVEAISKLLEGGIAGLASLANAASVAEGRLLEKVIAAIAESNPNLVVFTQVRLPVREDALELVDKNPETLFRGLTLDADGRTRKIYVADLILVDRISKVAYLVDIKRSLGSYELQRIIELRQRMLAAGLVTPDLLYKDHQRLVIDEVRVVILEAAGKRTDTKTGIWNLGHLDHLLGVAGASDHVRRIRAVYEKLTEDNLTTARERLRRLEERQRFGEGRGVQGGLRSTPPVGQHQSDVDVSTSDEIARAGRREKSDRSFRVGIVPPPPISH